MTRLLSKALVIVLLLGLPAQGAADKIAPRCKAVTKKGKRCPRAAKSKGYCSKHYMMKFPDRAMDKFDKTLDKL